jgi:hypothetical protein
MATEKEVLTKTKDLAEVMGKAIIGGLALCYGVGLLMLNLYYNHFGVYSVSLFRLNYVIASLGFSRVESY